MSFNSSIGIVLVISCSRCIFMHTLVCSSLRTEIMRKISTLLTGLSIYCKEILFIHGWFDTAVKLRFTLCPTVEEIVYLSAEEVTDLSY